MDEFGNLEEADMVSFGFEGGADMSSFGFEGGADVFSSGIGGLLITQNETGEQFTASTIDFSIDENGNGIVYFDGITAFELQAVNDYSALEQVFYSEFTIEQM